MIQTHACVNTLKRTPIHTLIYNPIGNIFTDRLMQPRYTHTHIYIHLEIYLKFTHIPKSCDIYNTYVGIEPRNTLVRNTLKKLIKPIN